jgi:hypothetical protein
LQLSTHLKIFASPFTASGNNAEQNGNNCEDEKDVNNCSNTVHKKAKYPSDDEYDSNNIK